MTLRLLDATALHTLRLAPPPESTFEFYTFERGSLPEYWDVIAIESQRDPPTRWELRLFHIEIEMLEEMDYDGEPVEFDTFNEALRGITVSPEELAEILHLLEHQVGEPVPMAANSTAQFHIVEPHDFAQLHVKPSNPWAKSLWYRYLADTDVQAAGEVTLVCPPRWNNDPRPLQSQRQRLSPMNIVTFEQSRLSDPAFDPLDTWGLSRIVFKRVALREFVSLLKQASY